MSLWEAIVEALALGLRRDERPFTRGQKTMMALALVFGAIVLALLVRVGWTR